MHKPPKSIKEMWDDEREIPEAPEFCSGITYYDAISIRTGGCGGAPWMPAVSYHEALPLLPVPEPGS
jgi:hypothetical protein